MANGSGATTPTLAGRKILPFGVKALYFQNLGQTSNCLVRVFLKWSDQSHAYVFVLLPFKAINKIQNKMKSGVIDVFCYSATHQR